jgi:hypothetical protein
MFYTEWVVAATRAVLTLQKFGGPVTVGCYPGPAAHCHTLRLGYGIRFCSMSLLQVEKSKLSIYCSCV